MGNQTQAFISSEVSAGRVVTLRNTVIDTVAEVPASDNAITAIVTDLTAINASIVDNLQIADAKNIVVGTTTGTKIGTATTQKLAFYNATPIVQRSGASQSALTDSTTGTAGTTISDVGGSFSQTTLNNNLASIVRLVNELRNAMVAIGLIKGSS